VGRGKEKNKMKRTPIEKLNKARLDLEMEYGGVVREWYPGNDSPEALLNDIISITQSFELLYKRFEALEMVLVNNKIINRKRYFKVHESLIKELLSDGKRIHK